MKSLKRILLMPLDLITMAFAMAGMIVSCLDDIFMRIVLCMMELKRNLLKEQEDNETEEAL